MGEGGTYSKLNVAGMFRVVLFVDLGRFSWGEEAPGVCRVVGKGAEGFGLIHSTLAKLSKTNLQSRRCQCQCSMTKNIMDTTPSVKV